MSLQKLIIIIVSLFALLGCATTTPIQSITSDRSKYIEEHFSVLNLSSDVRERLSKIPAFEQKFKKIKINFDGTFTELDKKETFFQRVVTINNLGMGYNQYISELMSNNFKTTEQLQLVYGGKILPLLTHSVYYRNDRVIEVNPNKVGNIEFNFDNPTENSNYVFEYEGAITGKYTMKCKSDKYYPASKLFNKIKGEALDLSCDQYINNVKSETHHFVFFKNFNVAIYVRAEVPNGSEAMTITDFSYE